MEKIYEKRNTMTYESHNYPELVRVEFTRIFTTEEALKKRFEEKISTKADNLSFQK